MPIPGQEHSFVEVQNVAGAAFLYLSDHENPLRRCVCGIYKEYL